jgi:hypothetical protein
VKFFLDHDVPAEVGRVLRQIGHEVIELRTPEGFEREAKCDRKISLKRHAGAFRPITGAARSISYWGFWKRSSASLHAGIADGSFKLRANV